MYKAILTILVLGGTMVALPGAVAPRSFEGTWRGVWQGYGQSSLTLLLTVRATVDGKFSGTIEAGAFQQPAASENQPLQLGAPPPHILPPPPPLPAPPPSGAMLNPRIQGNALVFQVKGPDATLVDFRLGLQGSNAGTLTITRSVHPLAYPEFQMKRTHS